MEFGVGFIQRGIVLFGGIGMDRGLPSACRSFIATIGEDGVVCHLVHPMYRELYKELYREFSIALLIRRHLCGHSITSYPGAFWWKGCCVKHSTWQSVSVMKDNICSTWIFLNDSKQIAIPQNAARTARHTTDLEH